MEQKLYFRFRYLSGNQPNYFKLFYYVEAPPPLTEGGLHIMRKKPAHPYDENALKAMRIFYKELLSGYPDVIKVHDIIKFTGFSKSAITNWVRNHHLDAIHYKRMFIIPKDYLLDFLTSDYYLQIIRKTETQIKTLNAFDLQHMQSRI